MPERLRVALGRASGDRALGGNGRAMGRRDAVSAFDHVLAISRRNSDLMLLRAVFDALSRARVHGGGSNGRADSALADLDQARRLRIVGRIWT